MADGDGGLGGLGWLEEDSGTTKSDLSDNVLGWLSSSPEDGKTMVSPDGADAGLLGAAADWVTEDAPTASPPSAPSKGFVDPNATATAPASLPASVLSNLQEAPPSEGDEPAAAGESMFSEALDTFFDAIDEGEEDTVNSVVLSASTARRVRGNRVERVVNTLLRYLTRTDPIKAEQLDSIFRMTVGRIVDAVNSEAIAVYFLTDDDKLVIAHVFYSKNLFKREPNLQEPFLQQIETLGSLSFDKEEGIVGRALRSKAPITSMNVTTDPDYVARVGRGTEFGVRSMLTVPLIHEDLLFGAIQVLNKDPTSNQEFFSQGDVKVLEEITTYTSRVIHRVKNPENEVNEKEMAGYVARLSKCEIFDLSEEGFELDERLIDVIGKENVVKFQVLPLKKLSSRGLRVAMVNPLDFQRRTNYEAASDYTIEDAVVAVRSELIRVVNALAGIDSKETVGQGEFSDIADEIAAERNGVEQVDVEVEDDENAAPIIRLANRIIEDAYARGASDIHIEPYEESTRVRYRIDGVCHHALDLPPTAISPLASRIKIMSGLNISERRLPQDGKIVFKQWSRSGVDIDLRVATGPMSFGEKICMRLLVKGSISLGLNAMGFSPENLKLYRWAAAQPYGMILNVGPTGSGKTTTLYSALTEVSTPENNVHTAEDPIEYPLHGINQMQMHKDIGLTFGSALKCFLRMDPDIILVGEIRDLETGEIAIEAALTGHLLFSTLHTNDAPGTVTRFIEMGIEPFMISSSLLLVCAQRLGRRLCKHCKVPITEGDLTAEEREVLSRDPRPIEEMFKKNPGGCKKCGEVGTKGRIGIHEALTLNEELRDLINRSASSDELKSAARRNGMMTMYQDALWKVKTGIMDLHDVIAELKADGDINR